MFEKLSRFVFGEQLSWNPPKRVRDAIDAQQVQSEILIGWVQLVLVCFFFLLYAAAPKTSAGTDFMPVPWALGAYLAFTLTRLGLSYYGLTPGWLLVASVVVDMALLLGLIWSFHLQYEQPPSFYLKAPTILYVFIFIALRALRFEARYVLLAGAGAAAGWLALTFYAITANPMLTRNYVTYMTSNSILIGAEIDKVISILVVTGILVVVLVRARTILIRAVAEETVAQDLSRFVPDEIAERIAVSDTGITPGDNEIKNGTVMFTDVEGFSTLSEKMAPDELAHLLNEYFAAVNEVLQKHGGTVVQFQGDAMVVVFNIVRDDPDHARNAVAAALGIQEMAATHTFMDGAVLKTRCGINTGDIVCGAIGSANMMLFTVHGDEVNIAARLEPLNKDFGTYVMVSAATRDACGDALGTDVGFTLRGEVVVRGRAASTAVYSVEGRVEEPTAQSDPDIQVVPPGHVGV